MSTYHTPKSDSVPQFAGSIPLHQRIIANVPTVTFRLFHLQYRHHIPPNTVRLIRNIYCSFITELTLCLLVTAVLKYSSLLSTNNFIFLVVTAEGAWK